MPPGEYGERLLVTVLYRRTQPLIRYEISDMVKLAPGLCSCGRQFRLIESIQGRFEEVLHFQGVNGRPVAIEPDFFTPILGSLPASGWQVTQEAEGLDVKLRGLPKEIACQSIVERLSRELTARGAVVPRINVVRVDSIPRSKAGKAPLVQSKIK